MICPGPCGYRQDLFRRVLLLGGLVLLLGSFCARAQSQFRQGVQAYKQGAFQEARTILQELVSEQPAYVGAEDGSAAYWLGKAYEASEQPDSMRWAWQRGVNALQEAGRFDARLFDASLWAQWSANKPHVRRAIRTYLALLSHVGRTADEARRRILHRHVAQLLPILPDRQHDQLFLSDSESPENWTFQENAGEWLVAWWRRQDPVPSTSVNERVEEHLGRVAEARSKFAYADRAAGWDERGDLYVRYGPPARRDSIPFTDAQFHGEVVRFGVGVHRGDFPENEIWSYPHIGERGHYLFVRKKDAFELGQSLDLLPRKLKRNFHAADRSQNRAYSSMAAMEYIYKYLSLHYQDVGAIYENVANYFVNQDVLRAVMPLHSPQSQGSGETVGFGPGERTIYQSFGPGQRPPSAVAQEIIDKSRHHQRVFVQQREREMPAHHSEVARTDIELPVALRTARFLDESGSTQVELFWGGDLIDRDEGAKTQIIRLSVVRQNSLYERRGTHSKGYVLNAAAQEGQLSPIVSDPLEVEAASDPFHLAVQWDRYNASGSEQPRPMGARTGRRTMRIDSLRALSSDPQQLEMSDLRPMVVSGDQAISETNPTEMATPYPFSTLSTEASLLLYFEVYHLGFNAEEQTEYEIAYEVAREGEDDGFLGLFGGEEMHRTETTSTYTGNSRRTSEVILLDWSDVASGSAQPVTITVRVTDETSGQDVERSIDFQVVPPSEE